MRNMKVGLIGCGFMGRMHANVYKVLSGAELVAVADDKPQQAEAFERDFGVPAYSTLGEMMSAQELDAIDICLPTYLHKAATVEAVRAGKHIFCEKPMAMTVAEADEMIAETEKAGVQLMIGHCIRFWPEYVVVKNLVDDGSMGKLVSINLTRYGQFPFWSIDNWLADESKAGGGVLDMHIHDTDYIHYLLGEPDAIESWGSVDERGPSHVFTTMTYGDTIAHLEGGWNLPTKTPFKMAFRAIFECGAAIMDAGPLTLYRPDQEPEVVTFPPMKTEGGGNISDLGGYYYELEYFVRCLQEGKPFETVTPQTSRKSLETTLEEIRRLKERIGA
jgi:predicted dehydrogenase